VTPPVFFDDRWENVNLAVSSSTDLYAATARDRERIVSSRESRTILIVVDGSAASRRALAYVARIVGRRRGFRLCLIYLLPPLPPRLLESRGTEDPKAEEQLSAQLKVKQRRWISTAEAAARRTLVSAHTMLRKAGFTAKAVEARFSHPVGTRDAANEVLDLAQVHKCGTVVVGRDSVSWLRHLLRGDLAEELLRRAKGLTLWVVE